MCYLFRTQINERYIKNLTIKKRKPQEFQTQMLARGMPLI